jgi:hypothetical protein
MALVTGYVDSTHPTPDCQEKNSSGNMFDLTEHSLSPFTEGLTAGSNNSNLSQPNFTSYEGGFVLTY